MIVIRFLRSLIILTLVSVILPIHAADSPAIEEVRGVYNECKSAEGLASTEKVILVRLLLRDNRISNWQPYKPEYKEQVLDEAHLFMVQRRLSSAHVFNNTPSGDWFKITEYYFRLDGTLAFIFSDLRPFYGNVRAETRLYYDPAGKPVRESRSIFDLQSGKTIKPEDANYMDNAAKVFLTADLLLRGLGYKL